MTGLREREALAARALEFSILTAARTGEVIGARLTEIDLLNKASTVPAARLKALREHRVPLSARALAILQGMQAVRRSDDSNAHVFPGRPGRKLNSGQSSPPRAVMPGPPNQSSDLRPRPSCAIGSSPLATGIADGPQAPEGASRGGQGQEFESLGSGAFGSGSCAVNKSLPTCRSRLGSATWKHVWLATR